MQNDVAVGCVIKEASGFSRRSITGGLMDLKDMLNKLQELKLDEKLFLDNFKVDKVPHLKLKDIELCRGCKSKPCINICPVGNYQRVDGIISLSWEGCLECGACRIACPHDAIEWNYPQGGFGIKYRHG